MRCGGVSVTMALSRACARLWRTCAGPGVPRVPGVHGHPALLQAAVRLQSSVRGAPALPPVPRTSLSRPPWASALGPAAPEDEQRQSAAVVAAVNSAICGREGGRLFAVVHFAGRQWKVTDEDLILVENHIEAECGARIRLEKVLLVGARDFTLVGRPLLTKELVCVEATVIEKTESRPKVHMRFHRRKRFQRKKILVQPQTVLRINSVRLAPALT